jgi:signal transduction histidine kinase
MSLKAIVDYSAWVWPALALRRAVIVLLHLVLLLPLASLAEDAILERAYLEDASGTLTWDDVMQAPRGEAFKAYTGPLNRGYSSKAVWMRLHLQGSPLSQQDGAIQIAGFAPWYVLRIQPGYIDEVTLYDPRATDMNLPKVGDRQPVPRFGYRSLNHNFVIPMSATPRTVWLRLQTTSTNLIHVEALTFAQATAKDSLQSLLLGIFVAFLLLFFLWAFVHWWRHRERLIAILAVHQLAAFVFSFTILGYLRLIVGQSVPAPWLDQFTSVMVLIATAAAIAFNRAFVIEFMAARWVRLSITAIFWVMPVLLVLVLMGIVRLAMHVNMVIVSVTPLLFLFAAINAGGWRREQGAAPPLVSRRVFIGYYATGLALLSLFTLPSLGLLDSPEISLQANSIYGFVTGALLLTIFQRRDKLMRKRLAEGQNNLEISRQKIAQEEQHRKDQAQFMAMLTHELKTPLSVLRLAIGLTTAPATIRGRFDQAIQDMSNVIDRFAWIDKFEERELRLHISGFDALQELDRLLFTHNASARITREAIDGPYPLSTDVRLFCTVLNNLVHNALRYSASESQVVVTLQKHAHEGVATIRIEVANLPGASGWPDPEKLFKKYYRSAGAQRQTGTGLGLYQAARITQQLGGTLSYAPDSGFVRFVWTCPC